jgi:hypothetical protein
MMRKAAFTLLGTLLIAGLAMQAAAASEHHARAGRDHHRWDRTYNQLREPNTAAPYVRDGYGKPAANVTQTCDVLWCYAD